MKFAIVLAAFVSYATAAAVWPYPGYNPYNPWATPVTTVNGVVVAGVPGTAVVANNPAVISTPTSSTQNAGSSGAQGGYDDGSWDPVRYGDRSPAAVANNPNSGAAQKSWGNKHDDGSWDPVRYGGAVPAPARWNPNVLPYDNVGHNAVVHPVSLNAATYVAQNRGASHTAPLYGHVVSRTHLNVAPAPGTW